jgi:hypothetical protein
LAPNNLVKFDINADVLGFHHLQGELLDLLDGSGSSPLELDTMERFAQVDCVFPLSWGLSYASIVGHLQEFGKDVRMLMPFVSETWI